MDLSLVKPRIGLRELNSQKTYIPIKEKMNFLSLTPSPNLLITEDFDKKLKAKIRDKKIRRFDGFISPLARWTWHLPTYSSWQWRYEIGGTLDFLSLWLIVFLKFSTYRPTSSCQVAYRCFDTGNFVFKLKRYGTCMLTNNTTNMCYFISSFERHAHSVTQRRHPQNYQLKASFEV